MPGLSERFHFHPLALEDCRHGVQRPKIEEYEGHVFFVFHAITGLDMKRALRLDFVELDGWLSRHYLVTVHDEPLAIVSQLMERVKANPSLLAHREHSAIDQRTRYYLRDVVSRAADTYISQVSQRTNDIIKVLSIIATIMLPLSFMAGLFGMNFEYLPGSHHPFGFQVMLGAMAVFVAVLLAIFRWRRWI